MSERKRNNKPPRNKRPQKRRPKQPRETPETPADGDLIAGRNPAIETLKSERDINKVFIQDGLSGTKIDEVVQLTKDRRIQLSFVPKTKLDQLVDGANHQGVVVAASAMDYATIDDLFQAAEERGEAPFFVLLDGVEDPHNLGSILRTADATGVHGIIIPKRRAVGLTATVAKASTGAIEHVPVARVTNLVQTIQELKDLGMWFFGTDMKGQDYREWKAEGSIGLVIGNEGKGLSRLVKEQMDGMVTIPMTGHVQSLNASVAAALLMYEGYRQRNPLN
ncbi:23S rRNA (guanosine(2251)-2'-O)-methyltransferase RlmB [Atopococcus tabaci]|uniref:23S rRNA (guanosine(2251)-2'-O)-methyltransferase RlmB n=1 Tax=Atopococcus tabaci TaxID=269774 RepID=UPI00040FE899|nr:23S rRNA (guanosine(2251)-2'-O)-methyltransferase RlmB [Atopococcus tabaci]